METEPPEEKPTATEEDLDAAYTEAAQTIVAELTLNAPPSETLVPDVPKPTLPPTSTPLPTNTPLPSDTPLPTNTVPPPVNTPTMEVVDTVSPPSDLTFKLVFEDDFSYTSGWVVGKSEEYHFHYTLGGYAMRNKLVEDMVWSVRSTPFSNVRVEAIGQRISGPRDGYYGVTCRHEDGSNYYAMIVGSDGTYGIALQLGGNLKFLKLEQDTEGRVHTGNGINHIRADCIGSVLTLYANGHKLMELEDTTISAGSPGFVVGTREKRDNDVLFTHFALYTPVE
jgi:hypothetical protein